jgi:GNAT superfamily N-acetyltransferase
MVAPRKPMSEGIQMDHFDLTTTQLLGAWRTMCAGSPGYQQRSADGVDYVFSGLPIAFFNVALVTARGVTADALADAGRSACAWAARQQVPWMFVVTHDGLEDGVDATQTLDSAGLAPMMPLTGMLATEVSPPASLPGGLQVEIPQDDERCADVLHVNALAYGMDLEAGQSLMAKRSFWASHVPVVGSVDGKAVCSAAVMMVDGYRYVALVATDPAHQRRGYADAAMRHALRVARDVHGPHPTVLHATEAGRPVYERMGYQTIAKHTIFLEKRFLEGH